MANLTLLMPALKHWTKNLHISFIFRCLNVADLELVFSSFLLVKLASIEEMLGKKDSFQVRGYSCNIALYLRLNIHA